MQHTKVFVTGCAICKTTLKLIDKIANAKGVAVQLDKVESWLAAELSIAALVTQSRHQAVTNAADIRVPCHEPLHSVAGRTTEALPLI